MGVHQQILLGPHLSQFLSSRLNAANIGRAPPKSVEEGQESLFLKNNSNTQLTSGEQPALPSSARQGGS